MNKLVSVFFDADVLIAGSASTTGASFILLQLCELGLLHGLTSEQVIAECQRNLTKKLPLAVPVFDKIVQNTLTVVPNPTASEIAPYQTMADAKDVPILVAAILQQARYLTTFNTRHYFPDPKINTIVCPPGELLLKIRDMLATLA